MDIDKLRDGYRPAAKRGAILFFVLAEMALVNSMYQYSLASYLDVFDFSLRKSLPDSILAKRLKNIMDTLTHNVYNYGCTGDRVAGAGPRLQASGSSLVVTSVLWSHLCPQLQSLDRKLIEVLKNGSFDSSYKLTDQC